MTTIASWCCESVAFAGAGICSLAGLAFCAERKARRVSSQKATPTTMNASPKTYGFDPMRLIYPAELASRRRSSAASSVISRISANMCVDGVTMPTARVINGAWLFLSATWM